jgi:hypothetical protein
MDRDLGKPKKRRTSSDDMCRVDACATRSADETSSPGHSATRPGRHTTRIMASSKAHDKDGTFNKEIYR